MQKTKLKGRMITKKEFESDLKAGKFQKLFDYLKENALKYNLVVRQDKLALYSHGRNLEIERISKYYKIRFNYNNADLILKKDDTFLDEITKKLSELAFDTSEYEEWKVARRSYITSSRQERTEWKSQTEVPEYKIVAKIPADKISEYDFATLLDTIYPIFRSYSENREEEDFRQLCISHYDTSQNDLIIFDVEYKPPFENASEKQRYKSYCMPNEANDRQFFKPDLVALRKENGIYKTYFIELKVNVSASISKRANIKSHIIDWQNYKTLYDESDYERCSFRSSVEYNLRLKSMYGLIECEDIEAMISKIDFDSPPELFIAVGLIRESEQKFKEAIAQKWGDDFAIWDGWNVDIIVGQNDPKILQEERMPIAKYIEEGVQKMKSKTWQERLHDSLKYLYIEDIPPKVSDKLKSEIAVIESKRQAAILEVIYALTSKIEKSEYPVIYDGFLADSLTAFLKGFTDIDPAMYEYPHHEEGIAHIFVPTELCEELVTYAQNLYGDQVEIRHVKGFDIDETITFFHLKFDFSDIPINLIIPNFPYQTILYDMSRLAEFEDYAFDDHEVLSYLQKKFGLKSVTTAIEELLNEDLPIMKEIHNPKTKVSLLYKLSFYKVFYPNKYYTSLLTNTLCEFTDIDELIESLEKNTLGRNDTLGDELREMYDRGFKMTREADKTFLIHEDYKEEIVPWDMQDLYPFIFEER